MIRGRGVRSRLGCDFGRTHVGAAAAEDESQNPSARGRATLHLCRGKLPVLGGFACQTSEIFAGAGRVQGRFDNIAGSIDRHFHADSNVAPNAVPGRLRYLAAKPVPRPLPESSPAMPWLRSRAPRRRARRIASERKPPRMESGWAEAPRRRRILGRSGPIPRRNRGGGLRFRLNLRWLGCRRREPAEPRWLPAAGAGAVFLPRPARSRPGRSRRSKHRAKSADEIHPGVGDEETASRGRKRASAGFTAAVGDRSSQAAISAMVQRCWGSGLRQWRARSRKGSGIPSGSNSSGCLVAPRPVLSQEGRRRVNTSTSVAPSDQTSAAGVIGPLAISGGSLTAAADETARARARRA